MAAAYVAESRPFPGIGRRGLLFFAFFLGRPSEVELAIDQIDLQHFKPFVALPQNPKQ